MVREKGIEEQKASAHERPKYFIEVEASNIKRVRCVKLDKDVEKETTKRYNFEKVKNYMPPSYEVMIELKRPCNVAKDIGDHRSFVRSPMNVSHLEGLELYNYWNVKQVIVMRGIADEYKMKQFLDGVNKFSHNRAKINRMNQD